jgi:small neutral amino acid transporter SnatA (MarC family)
MVLRVNDAFKKQGRTLGFSAENVLPAAVALAGSILFAVFLKAFGIDLSELQVAGLALIMFGSWTIAAGNNYKRFMVRLFTKTPNWRRARTRRSEDPFVKNRHGSVRIR